VIPREVWKFGGVRPLNRPERRVALMAKLSSPENWRLFLRLARIGDYELLKDFFTGLAHDFWDRHCTLPGLPLAEPAALLGGGRLSALLFNTIWPLASHGNADEVTQQLRMAVSGGQNRLQKIAAVCLLGERSLRGLKSSLLGQEGLLQIYRDFCLCDYSQCRDCGFSSLVRHYL
jgi:hypothetical protein